MKIDKEIASQALADTGARFRKMSEADYAVLELMDPIIEHAMEGVVRGLIEAFQSDSDKEALGACVFRQIYSHMLSMSVDAWYSGVVAAERQIEKDRRVM